MPPSPPRFDTGHRRHSLARRLRKAWTIWGVPLVALGVMAIVWAVFRPPAPDEGWTEVTQDFALCGASDRRAAACVVDGDTVVIGFGEQRRRIRLTGFDTPEINGACDAERTLAQTAKMRLHSWIGEGAFEWNGGASPPRDKYGRELRAARRIAPDGKPQLLSEMMIDAGLAERGGWGARPRDWCR